MLWLTRTFGLGTPLLERIEMELAASEVRRVKREGSTYDQTRELAAQGLSIKEIADSRGLGVSTVVGHLEKLVQAKQAVDLERLMPPAERLRRIGSAFEEAGTMNLTPVRQALGEEFTYAELRLVRLWLRQNAENQTSKADV